MKFEAGSFDAAVIGAGHAGIEAARMLAVIVLPTAALFLREGEDGKGKRAWWLLGVMAAGPAAMALAASGRLSPQVVQAEKLPFYMLTKSLSILSVMERFEPVLSVALLIGMFCMAALTSM